MENIPLRASQLNHAAECHGFLELYQECEASGNMPGDTEATRIGSLVHEWFEIALTRGVDDEAAMRIERELEEEEIPLRACLDEAPAGAEQYVEHRLMTTVGPFTVAGTADLMTVDPTCVVVTDWKSHRRKSAMKPMAEDLQMLAYGLAAWPLAVERMSEPMVLIRRALVRHEIADRLYITRDNVEMARDALGEELFSIFGDPTYTPGSACEWCLLRGKCSAIQEVADQVCEDIQPYRGGLFPAEDDVLRFITALPRLKELLDHGRKAAEAWVNERGPIIDPHTGKEWAPSEYKRDVFDTGPALFEVLDEHDVDLRPLVKPSKGALEKLQLPSRFWTELRDRGILKKVSMARWGWRKAKP